MYIVIWYLLVLHSLGQVKSNLTSTLPERDSTNLTNTEKPGITNAFFIDWLLTGCWSDQLKKCPYPQRGPVEYPGYDGWNNNVGRPELGAVDTPLLRRWPAAYEDGVYKPAGHNRPEPLELSEKLLSGNIGSKSRTGKNALLVFFGQQVVEEILDAQRPACPPEYFNIKIPEGHRYRTKPGHTEKPFLRTRYDARTGFSPNNPRQQLNEITPFLDGGLIYGTTKAWSDVLRLYSNGTQDPNGLLASSHGLLYPEYNTIRLPMANPPPPIQHHTYTSRHYTEEVTRYFKLGNPRGNENPFLLTFGIVWFRWHNHLAYRIKRINPNWSGDKIFNEARKWVIATQQHIVTNEWLPMWLGRSLPEYKGYDASVDPQIDQFFQAAAFRFGHTLVPPGVYMRDYGRNGCHLRFNGRAIRTCNSYWMSHNALYENLTRLDGVIDIERLLMGMSVQLCEEEDHKIVEDLRGHLFGPLEFSRRDLMALNIQRGRDHGLPDYNTARMAYNLPRVENVSYYKNVAPEILKEFQRLYNNSFDDVDVWVGGILETVDGPGPLFQAIIHDQFERIRSADRFWYKNTNNGLFTKDEIKRLEQLSLYDVLISITLMDPDDIPKNPFRVPVSESDIHPSCTENKILVAGNCRTFGADGVNIPCFHVSQINYTNVDNCTEAGTYDYFTGSEISFSLTISGLVTFIIGFITLIVTRIRIKRQRKMQLNSKVRQSDYRSDEPDSMFTASEWIDRSLPNKPLIIVLSGNKKQIQLKNQLGHLTRLLDFTYTPSMTVYTTSDNHYVMIRVKHNYDTLLKFQSDYIRGLFLQALDNFVAKVGVIREDVGNITTKEIMKQAVTRKSRQKKLESFFRVVFSQAFHIAHSEDEILQIDSTVAKEIIYTELTIIEFAEALSMRPDSEFIKKIFNLVDKDKNGFVSFREFVDMLVIFLKGNAEDKVKLMFDMYDVNGTGRLLKEDFVNMLRSFMETVNADVTNTELETLVQTMMNEAGISRKEAIDLQDFQRLLGKYSDKLSYAELEFNVGADGKSTKLHAGSSTVRSTFIGQVKKTVESIYADPEELKSRIAGNVPVNQGQNNRTSVIDGDQKIIEDSAKHQDDYWYPIQKYIANKQLQIFWISLYTAVLFAIFAERAYYYSIEREHSGLRRIAGYGVTVTRGAASAMMFTYSTLLITMCQNTITYFRDSVLQYYIPFNSVIEMHKYIASWALVFTVVHVIGHGINFYHISTQTADDLTCLFPNFFHATHELPKFDYWCWRTMTGVTGIALTILTAVIFLCSLQIVRKELYYWFYRTHCLYPVFYVLLILHGTGRLIQEPYFHYFFLGPVTLFAFDKLITATRKTTEIPIIKAELLPSDVTCITFPKPPNFQYKSGQWVRIACPGLHTNEYHPFTLSSAPNESNLTVHIRAVGPWTINIRNKLDPATMIDKKLPTIHVDGPYGEGHQNWNKYDIAIMVGGGIGVTPFASILKDIVFKANQNLTLGCKKVYFLWITRTQKQFEWMVDILRDLEKSDVKNVVSVHIFITQFYEKFDLRTILLYICERHFQRICNKSLFTGLVAVTHFGRPKFHSFFQAIQRLHPRSNKVGIFSCGSPSMTRAVDVACRLLNIQEDNQTLFQHHYKNF